MILLYWTEGQMTQQEVVDECFANKWVPLMVIRHEGVNYLPVFKHRYLIPRFIERNDIKGFYGEVVLSDADLMQLHEKGFMTVAIDFPRRMKDCFEIGIEIHEFQSELSIL